MSTQKDIYAAGSENRLPMLNKDNYVPWSSRLLRYAKIPFAETFHEQTDEELAEKEVKQMEADDQAIQIILMGLPEDIYAAVESCKTAQEIWLRVQQMMKDPTTAMNMKLVLMAKVFKLNYSTPTNNNQRISSNPHNRQIAQPGMNLGQDKHMQMVRVQNLGIQNVGNQNGLIVVPGIANQNL
ncbi:hypothetical protein Tco_0931494, partial [Tanacetum coccineum]